MKTLNLFALSLVLLSAANAIAADPAINAIEPYGLQRGTEVEVQFRGSKLADARQLLLYSPGITVKSLAAANDGAVKATLAVAADCRLGLHAVRLVTESEISNLHLFSVGALPELKETEPNSEFASPQAVALNSTINGVIENEDEDFFVVEAKKGQRIVAELEGLRLGNSFFDPYVAILNEARFELAKSDDRPLLKQDCLCSLIAPEDGKYIIQVRESAYGGDGNSKYRLHVGSFPRPTAVLPAGGKPGETLQVRWIGDPAGEFTTTVTLPTDGSSTADLLAADDQGSAPSPNVVRVSNLDNILEAEPNNDSKEATAATAPAALNGIISQPDDTDHFKFAAKKGQVFDIQVYARNPLRSPLDSVLNVFRASNGAGIGGNDDNAGSPDSYFRFTAPEDDDYLVRVRDHLGSGGPDYIYRVEISPVAPSLTLSLPERQQYISTTLNVAQGNRMALMLNASRANFGGPLEINLAGMPAGMTLQGGSMAENASSIPVLFSATAEAPLAAALGDLTGTEKEKQITGRLQQRTMLVRGQNNTDVWGHDADRMAVAITKALPFEINIVQPQVPICRSGSMDLKIVAKRAEGFTAPIAVSMLYNPSGIGSSGSINIAEGQTEATIPLTANGGAAIGKHPIVVIGEATVGNGRIEAATQMAELEIADSFYNITLEKSAVEQGQETSVVIKVERKAEITEASEIQLLGLPAGTAAVADKIQLAPDAAEAVFQVKAEAEAREGIFKTLVCRAVVMRNNEPITTTFGGGELRIDKPIPPKVEVAAKPEPKPEPMPMPEKQPEEKRLSRLEQLRLQREQERDE